MADKQINDVDATYDEETKTLSFVGTHGPIKLFDMRDIHFGTTTTDLNLCNPETHYYHFNSPDPKTFDSNKTSLILTSNTPNVIRDLNLTLSLLASGVINIHWTYANNTGVDKIPFEVPTTIIDPEKEILCETKNLSNYISFS